MCNDFYLDEQTGEACYRGDTRLTGQYIKFNKQRNVEYWNSLTEAQQEIIKWCRTDKVAQEKSLPMAQVRERCLDAFCRIVTGKNETPKKVEKYDICYAYFEEFKKYVHDNN